MEKKVTKELKKRMTDITEEMKDIISEILREGLVHTLEALDFIDDINMLSVSF